MTNCGCKLKFRVKETEKVRFTFDLAYHIVGGDIYVGPYNITPKFIQQVLPTTDKTLQDDVTVEVIPVEKTQNIGGGYTVVIGG